MFEETTNGSTELEPTFVTPEHFEGVKHKIAGVEFVIKSPSWWTRRITDKHRREWQRITFEKYAENKNVFDGMEKDMQKTIKSGKDKDSEGKTPYITAAWELMNKAYDVMFDINTVGDELIFRFIQLLILNDKNPSWIDSHETFDMPSNDLLETAVTMNTLKKRATTWELMQAIKIYASFQHLEEMRKNWQGLGQETDQE